MLDSEPIWDLHTSGLGGVMIGGVIHRMGALRTSGTPLIAPEERLIAPEARTESEIRCRAYFSEQIQNN